MANAADVIFFNRGGGGAPGFPVDQFSWQIGEALCVDCTTSAGGSKAGTLVIQAALSGTTVGGASNGDPSTKGVSYQLSIPVKTTLTGAPNTKNTTLTITGTGAGTFNMYSTTNTFDYASGCGFGPLQGTGVSPACPLTSLGPWTPILSGTVDMEGPGFGSFDITQTSVGSVGSITTSTPIASSNADGITTVQMGGSITFLIDASFRDPAYFVTDITTLTVDANIASASFLAPMSVPRSEQILTHLADMGDTKLNGPGCIRGLATAAIPCDQQYQVSANTQFFTTPEPGALALMGLGLGFLGMAVRRRRAV